jgi:hypothetical protein
MFKSRVSILGISMFAVVLSGCGQGEFVELSPTEVREFMDDEESGFVYVANYSEPDEEKDVSYKTEIQKIMNEERVNVVVFDPKDITEDNPDFDDYRVRTSAQSLSFYEKGELVGELDLDDVDSDDTTEGLNHAIKYFVQDMKETYQ